MSILSVFKPLFIDNRGRWKEGYYMLVAHPGSLQIRKTVEAVAGHSDKVLDIGGRKSPYTRRLRGRVTILDKMSNSDGYLGFTDPMIDTFKKESSLEVVVGDAEKLPFPNSTFDSFLCIEVIEHIREDKSAIAEMARILSPNGHGLLTTPNGAVVPNKNPYHIRHYQPDEFEKILLKSFNCVKLFTIDPWLRFSHYLSLRLRKFRPIDILAYSFLRPIYFAVNFLIPTSDQLTGAVLVAIVSEPKNSQAIADNKSVS